MQASNVCVFCTRPDPSSLTVSAGGVKLLCRLGAWSHRPGREEEPGHRRPGWGCAKLRVCPSWSDSCHVAAARRLCERCRSLWNAPARGQTSRLGCRLGWFERSEASPGGRRWQAAARGRPTPEDLWFPACTGKGKDRK